MKWQWYLLAGFAVLVGAGSHLALRGNPQGTAGPGLGALSHRTDQVAANGVVEGARPEVALRSEIVGTIAAIPFRENQQVKKGELLIELANESRREQVALAEAELAIARADLDRLNNGERAEKRSALKASANARRAIYLQAQKDWERVRLVQVQRAASQEQADTAYYLMLRAKAELEQADLEYALV